MNTSRLLLGLGIIICLLLPSVIALMPANTTQAQPADSAWPMFRQNPGHTGRSPYSGPEVPKLKWSFTTESEIFSSPAMGADGTIYVGSEDNKLYAINSDGSKKWDFPTGRGIGSSPAIGADGTIYVGSWDSKLYAINPDGSKKWDFPTGSDVDSSPAIGADGTIYVGSWDNKLYAINPNGSKKWDFTTGSLVSSSPAIGADGTVYVGSWDNKLYAIKPDGSKKWDFTTGSAVFSSPTIGADGTVYVGSYDYKLYAINPDGSKKWDFATGNAVPSSPAIGADSTIYVGSGYSKLYAVNPNGSKKWDFATGGVIASSPAIGADGTVYVGSYDYKLYAINPDGSKKWDFATGGVIASSPAIGADGTIYVASYDNKLYAITEEFDLKISSSAGGSVSAPGEGTFTYDRGAVVNLVAEAEEGYRFVNWTGNIATIANVNAASTTITMNGDYSITANFMAQYDLTISRSAGGLVDTPGVGTFTYDAGIGVNLVAEAEEGYRFVNWTGHIATIANVNAASTTITMNGDYSITANFMAQCDLTISSTEGGSVGTPGTGSFTYDRGTGVTIVAEAKEGYRFVEWTGDVGAVANVDAAQTTITMNDEYSITANFERRVNWVLIGGIGGGLIIAGLVVFLVRRNKSARNK